MTRTGALETQLSMDAALERAEDWAGKVRQGIADWYTGCEFTADDVRTEFGNPPGHGDALGAVLRNLHRAGVIRPVGHVTSSRPDAHGRTIREWRRA